MNKVVIISGSTRKGNTLGIANIYANEIQKKNCSVKILDLSSMKLGFCDGCLSCDETQKCKMNDGFDAIIEEIKAADLVIIGTPARWRLLSGELKCFIDRLNPYAAIEGYAGLKVFIYGVGQSSEEEGSSIIDAINSVSAFANDAGMIITGKQAFYGLYGPKDYLQNIDEIEGTCIENINELYEGKR